MLQPLVEPAVEAVILDGILSALTAHPRKGWTAPAVRATIAALGARTPLEMMFAGQALLFSALLADAAKDLFTDGDELTRPRALSTINALNRSLHQNLSLFQKRAAAEQAAAEKQAAQKPPAEKPAAREPAPQEAPPVRAEKPAEADAGSWLDEPFVTWVVETPAQEALRVAADKDRRPPRADPERRLDPGLLNVPRTEAPAVHPA